MIFEQVMAMVSRDGDGHFSTLSFDFGFGHFRLMRISLTMWRGKMVCEAFVDVPDDLHQHRGKTVPLRHRHCEMTEMVMVMLSSWTSVRNA